MAAIQSKIGLIGCGNMGSAILQGLFDAETVDAKQARVYDVDSARSEALGASGASVAESVDELAKNCDVVILATKPQDMDAALASIKPVLTESTLIVSIAAGISIAYIRARLDEHTHVVRVMPNTPALVGACAAGIAYSDGCTDEDKLTAKTLFASIGVAVDVDEKDIDTVTALSGSGPAYFFYLVECLVSASARLGLDEENANRLAGQTLYGAGKLLMESGESASTLRERVTSKGGTTAAALDQFRSDNLEAVIRAGVEAAAARSQELGK